VTLRELCTHTSGLPRLPRTPSTTVRAIGSAWFGIDPYRGIAPAAVLRQAKRQRLSHRGRQRYSNLGAAVAGLVLAAATGHDFPTLLAERILGPLGLRATRIPGRADAVPRGWTAGGRRSRPWLMDGYAPAGGVVSTIADMTLLARALLDGSAPCQSAIQPIDQVGPGRPARTSGLFWVVDTLPGTADTMIWHNGRTGGYSAFLALYPQTRSAVIVLANVARGAEQRRIAMALTRWLRPSRTG
jgi:CubicO group peptidase (beta-lactamase class C family)